MLRLRMRVRGQHGFNFEVHHLDARTIACRLAIQRVSCRSEKSAGAFYPSAPDTAHDSSLRRRLTSLVKLRAKPGHGQNARRDT